MRQSSRIVAIGLVGRQPRFTITAARRRHGTPTGPRGAPVRRLGDIRRRLREHHGKAHNLAKEIAASDRPVRLLHIDDYNPSGVHLSSSLDEQVRALLMRLNPNARVSSKRIAILPEHVARFRLQTAPAKTTDNRSFDGIGADATATVQAEALSPSDLGRWSRPLSAMAGTRTPPIVWPSENRTSASVCGVGSIEVSADRRGGALGDDWPSRR